VLVRGLPPDSATRIRVDGGPDAGPPFLLLNYQLADVYDQLAVANWQRANDGVPKNKQTKPPKPYPRPEAVRAASDRASARAAKLENLRRRAAERRELIASGAIA
jgi:hypothetical protein